MPSTNMASLALLPAEIKILVLSHMPDYESMKSLAHASSIYHHAYLDAREAILHHVTMNTLIGVGLNLLDPWFAILVPRRILDGPDRVIPIMPLLKSYARGRIYDRSRLPSEESLEILTLQRKFKFIVEDFCQVNLTRNPLYPSENLRLGPGDQSSPRPSDTENCRLYRAIWRWELYSRLFGWRAEVMDYADLGRLPNEFEIARDFLGLFPIHEIEELACLHSSAKYKLEGKVDPTMVDSVVTLGPAFLYSILSEPGERAILDSVPSLLNPTMRETLHAYEWWIAGGEGWPRKAIEGSSRVDSMPTDGWLWASLHGPQNTDYKLRRWGYVFWDRMRLDEWGVNQQRLLNWSWHCWDARHSGDSKN